MTQVREWAPNYYPARILPVVFDPSKFCDGMTAEDIQQPWPEAPNSWMDIHQSTAKVLVAIAGRRGGKSTGINADLAIFNAMTCPAEVIRKFQGSLECWYVGPTKVQTSNIIWERMKYLTRDIQDRNKPPNEKDLLIKLINGMWLRLKGGDQDPDSLRGNPLWYVILDEARCMSSRVLDEYIQPATTDKDIVENGGGKVRIITSPGGHDWVYNKWLLGRHDKTGRYQSFRWASWQSEYSNLAELAFIYREHKARGDMATWRQEYAGDFLARAGAIYKTFDIDRHVRAFEPRDDWDLILGVDNGCQDPTVCLVAFVDHEGRLWFRNEHYQKDMPLRHHAAVIQRFIAKYKREPKIMVMDQTNAQLFHEYATFGLYFSKARNVANSVVPGIHRVQELLEPLNAGLPGIIIHPECQTTIQEMAKYRWKEHNDPEKDGFEIPMKSHDHTCDVVRYIAMARPEPSTPSFGGRHLTMTDRVRGNYPREWDLDRSSECGEYDGVIGGRW